MQKPSMKKKQLKTETITTRCEPDMVKRIDRLLKNCGITRSLFIYAAVKSRLEDWEER